MKSFLQLLLFLLTIDRISSTISNKTTYRNSSKSLKNYVRSLEVFTRDNTGPFYMSYFKDFVTINSSNASQFNQTVLVSMRSHVDDLCPYYIQFCWCGFVEKSEDSLSGKSPGQFVFIRLCLTDPMWEDNIKELMAFHFDRYDRSNKEADPNIKARQIQKESMFTLNRSKIQSTQNVTKTILDQYRNSSVYKHDDSLCPAGFKWCWCGLVNTIDEYHGAFLGGQVVKKPVLVIDCRPYEQRRFETRKCRPDEKSVPFYKKDLSKVKETFLCGYSEFKVKI